jgi:hypothetical protein
MGQITGSRGLAHAPLVVDNRNDDSHGTLN